MACVKEKNYFALLSVIALEANWFSVMDSAVHLKPNVKNFFVFQLQE
jgi:hypothetical protein